MGKPTESRVIPLVGRQKEVDALARAIQSGQSRLIVAALPEHRVGRRIRFLPLRMDVLPAFI
jgi:hypothetical protein